jgi:hypothetical protein
MNVIELMWHDLKYYLRIKDCPTVDSIVNRIFKFFHYKLPARKCTNYLLRLEKVLDIVIKRGGGWSDC